jgi:hypothetical protein
MAKVKQASVQNLSVATLVIEATFQALSSGTNSPIMMVNSNMQLDPSSVDTHP